MNFQTTYNHDYYWPRTLYLNYKRNYENKYNLLKPTVNNICRCKCCLIKQLEDKKDNVNDYREFLKHPYIPIYRFKKQNEPFVQTEKFNKSEYQDEISKLGEMLLRKNRSHNKSRKPRRGKAQVCKC